MAQIVQEKVTIVVSYLVRDSSEASNIAPFLTDSVVSTLKDVATECIDSDRVIVEVEQ